MWELSLYILGAALRYGIYTNCSLIPWTLKYFLIHSTQHVDDIRECSYTDNRDFSFVSSQCDPALRLAGWLTAGSSDSEIYVLAAVVSQSISFVLIRTFLRTDDTWRVAAAHTYWLNPVTVAAATLSPVPSCIHTLILLIAISLEYNKSVCALFIVSVLVSLQKEYFPLIIPIVYFIMARRSVESESDWHRAGIALTGFVLGTHILLYMMHTRGISDRPWDMSGGGDAPGDLLEVLEYVPSFGIGWYLRAQMFPSYWPYFQFLMQMQSYLYVLPLCLRLPNGTLIAHILTLLKYVQFFATVAVITLFGSQSSFSDVMFVFCTLLRYSDVVSLMRHKELLLLVLALTMISSPVMLSLWVDAGSGNANYLFFQSAAMCLACVFLIVEFIRCAMKLRKIHHNSR